MLTRRLHLQGRRTSHARNQLEAGDNQSSFVDPVDGGRMFFRNIDMERYGVIFEKIGVFVTTAVKISNPA
jgi:hypothetical protein